MDGLNVHNFRREMLRQCAGNDHHLYCIICGVFAAGIDVFLFIASGLTDYMLL